VTEYIWSFITKALAVGLWFVYNDSPVEPLEHWRKECEKGGMYDN
jgi:hypothetical protein